MSECNPACQKIIIDTGMGRVAAEAYATVVEAYTSEAINPAAARFYAGVLRLFERAAQAALPKLNKDQTTRLMAQVDQGCYRADYLISWARRDLATIRSKAAEWTEQLFQWAKDDQTFITNLIKEGFEGASA